MKKIMEHNRKGFVLVLSLLTTTILLALVIPYTSRVVTDYRLTSKIYDSNAALNLAEAGVERAIWEIRYNNSDDGTFSDDSFETPSGDKIGEYEATVASSDNSATITSYGYVPDKSSYKAMKTVMVTYAFHRAFGKGVVGKSGITMSGQADIDSYDSSKKDNDGNLVGYNGLLPDGSLNIGQEGDIASNGPITLSGQSKVWGNANPGSEYPFSGIPNVTGTYGTLQVPLTVDPISDDFIAAALDGNNNSNIHQHVTVDGQDTEVPYPLTDYVLSESGEIPINLSGGTYYFASISTSGQAKINVEGPSTIYVVGNINIAGQGIVNTTTVPKNLLLYSTGSNIQIAGQGVFYGAIYAPAATVTYTGQAAFCGSIVCGFNADKGQAALHYDKDLAKKMPPFVVNKVTSWQET